MKIKLVKLLVLVLLSILIFSLISGCFESTEVWGDAPDFTLTTIDGETFTLSNYLGKVVVIDFTAVNCYWCGEGGQMDEFHAVYDEFGSNIVLISIDVWYDYPYYETDNQLRLFKEKYNSQWIFAMDTHEEDVKNKYHAVGVPNIVIIDKNGNIYQSFSGLTLQNKLIEAINEASIEGG